MGADALTDAAEPPAAEPPAGPPHAEGWSVVARRVSGLVLLVVVPVHLALTRVFEDPADSTVPLVREQWSRPGWRLLECLFFAAVAVHVVASVRVAASRSHRSGWVRTAVVSATAVVATTAAVFASAVVLTAPW